MFNLPPPPPPQVLLAKLRLRFISTELLGHGKLLVCH
jgi:hypothetical protein